MKKIIILIAICTSLSACYEKQEEHEKQEEKETQESVFRGFAPPDRSKKEKSTGFDMRKAWDKTKAEYSDGSFSGKLEATASLIGKGLFNVGFSLGDHAVNTVKDATEIAKDYENKDEAF